MAQCTVIVNVSGSEVLAPAAAASEPCTSLVVLTPAEYEALSHNPFNLTPEDGALVAGAVVSVWAMAWAFRALYGVLRPEGESPE